MKNRLAGLLPVLWAMILAVLPSPLSASGRLSVFVSIPPQKYFVEQIGKDRVEVSVMVQPGTSPHTYEPRPKQMVAISRTRLYFTIGVEFETVWIKKLAASNPAMEIVATQQGIQRIPISGAHIEDDRHEQQGSDPHDGLDPHIWLSPPLVQQQARTMLAALQKTDPANAAFYAANCDQFLQALSDLDQGLKDTFRGKQNRQFLVFHPTWGYFAHAYGLQQIAIEIEGKNPKPAQLQQIIQHAREHQIRIIFAQPQFSVRNAKLVAKAINGEVVLVDPLAENWMANLRLVADKFQQAMQ
ncbi:zinc ABC transporter substrate-binding protein [bacterium]|nr:zinc ABC transporter substrate-binding protein [bacterium]